MAPKRVLNIDGFQNLGFGKGGLLEKRSFLESLEILEILENLEILEILESPKTVDFNKGEPVHLLEILDNLEILEILEIPPVKRPPFVMTPFSGPENHKFWGLSKLATLVH